MIDGSQEIAFPETVETSALKRFSTSPLLYLFIASQSESMILSNISAWIALLILMPNFSVMRLSTLPTTREKIVEPIITARSSANLSVLYPVMMSIKYLLAILPTSPIVVLTIPRMM